MLCEGIWQSLNLQKLIQILPIASNCSHKLQIPESKIRSDIQKCKHEHHQEPTFPPPFDRLCACYLVEEVQNEAQTPVSTRDRSV